MRVDSVALSEAASSLVPYRSARSLLKGDGWLFLDANESPFACPLENLTLQDLNRYPDPNADRLCRAIAAHYGVEPDNVLVTNGTDELIDLSFRTFVRRGQAVLTSAPTYGMYRVTADTQAIRYCSVPLDAELQPDLPALASKFAGVDLLCLCNPNNPTGTVIEQDRLSTLLQTFPGLVLVDEAYGEFADAECLGSAIEWVKSGAANLIVMRTFSKAFAAAGLRLGYGIGPSNLIKTLHRMKPPYNVGRLAQSAGLALWERRRGIEDNVRILIDERRRIVDECSNLGCHVFRSAANFLLMRLPEDRNSREVYDRLRDDYRIVVRLFEDGPHLENTLRVTVGSPEDNILFLDAFRRLLS